MASKVFLCPLCDEFSAPSFQLLLLHIRLVHSSQPGFSVSCGIHGCQHTFRNMKTFTNHIYGFHQISHYKPQVEATCSSNNASDSGDDASEDSRNSIQDEPSPHVDEFTPVAEQSVDSLLDELAQDLQSYAAVWMLKIKEVHKLTQSTLDNIIQDVTSLSQHLLDKMHTAVQTALAEVGISQSQVPQLSKIFNPDGPLARPFRGLESAYQQLQYCRKNLGFVVCQLQ